MKVINTLAFVLIFIIIIPIIATMVPTGPVKFMTVTGSSMEPTITDSDIVIVNTVKTQPEVGDIVSFRHIFNENQSFIVTHRVVKVVDEGYVTQGDAYPRPDDFIVAPEDVVGVMFFKIPYIGALVRFAGTVEGLLVLVILPALILILQEVSEITSQMKEQK
ncbi:signal peptidase I [Methanosarcina siciliae]|uniref:signal peptidase I n=1 Tax=Methanosarcina siciliae TaxID=38027 RepID=UPI0006987DD6|nr:signal peptidase I [Methanosarcina siciliae]